MNKLLKEYFIEIRLSRDDKQFEKDLRKAMLVSQKVDTSLVVVNEYAEMDTSNETTPHCEDNDNHREVDTSKAVPYRACGWG